MGCVPEGTDPIILYRMSEVKDLLEAYSKLRKRRYSLSERLISEQQPGRDLSYLNRNFPGGVDPVTAETLLAGLKSIQQAPVGTPLQPWQSEDPASVTWLDPEGAEHTANAADLEEYLMGLGGEEGAVGEEVPEEGGVPLEELPPPPLPPIKRTIGTALQDLFDSLVQGDQARRKDDTKEGPGKPRDIVEDLENLDGALEAGRGSTSLAMFVKAHWPSEGGGIWDDDGQLQAGKVELEAGLDALAKAGDALQKSLDEGEDCVDLATLSEKEKDLLNNFKLRGSSGNRAVWWDGDAVFARRALADQVPETKKHAEVKNYGVKAFGSNTAVWSIVHAMSQHKICQSDKEKKMGLPQRDLVAVGRGSGGKNNNWVRVIFGLMDEDISTLAKWMVMRRNNMPTAPGEDKEGLGTLKKILLKLNEKNLAQVIDYVKAEQFAGVIPGPGDEVFEHPFVSQLQDNLEELKVLYPEITPEEWDTMTGNQVLLLFLADELIGRQKSVQVWGIGTESLVSNESGYMADVDPETGEVIDHHKKTADTVMRSPNNNQRIKEVMDFVVPEGMECLSEGLDKEDNLNPGYIGNSMKRHMSAGSIPLQGLAGETRKDLEKFGGLMSKRIGAIRAQSECFAANGGRYEPIPPERLDELEDFCLNELAQEAVDENEVGDILQTNPREFKTAIRQRKSSLSYDDLEVLDTFQKRSEEIAEAQDKLDGLEPGSPAHEAQEKEVKAKILMFQKDWVGVRRSQRLSEDPENMGAYLGMVAVNSCGSQADQVIELNEGGGNVSVGRESVVIGQFGYRAMAGDPTLKIEPADSTGPDKSTIAFTDTETGGRMVLNYRFQGGDSLRNREDVQINEAHWKACSRSHAEIASEPEFDETGNYIGGGLGPAEDTVGKQLDHKITSIVAGLVQAIREELTRESQHVFQKV